MSSFDLSDITPDPSASSLDPMPTGGADAAAAPDGSGDRDPQFAPGTRVGDQFTLERPLGAARGAYGVIYLATQDHLNRTVAIKFIQPKHASGGRAREHLKRFLLEAETISTIDHAAVIPVYACGEHEGLLYYAMAYKPTAQNLRQRLAHVRGQGGVGLPEPELRAYAEQAARGLRAVHARDLVHRDIKPENLLVYEDIDGPQLRVIDFGLARGPSSDLTRTNAVLGTVRYMASDYLSGAVLEPTPANDMVALGATLYLALTGKHAVPGEDENQVADDIMRGIRPELPSKQRMGLNHDWDEIIMALMGHGTGPSIRDAEGLLFALQTLDPGQASPPAEPTRPETPLPMTRRGRVRALGLRVQSAGLLVLCALFVLGVGLVTSVGSEEPDRVRAPASDAAAPGRPVTAAQLVREQSGPRVAPEQAGGAAMKPPVAGREAARKAPRSDRKRPRARRLEPVAAVPSSTPRFTASVAFFEPDPLPAATGAVGLPAGTRLRAFLNGPAAVDAGSGSVPITATIRAGDQPMPPGTRLVGSLRPAGPLRVEVQITSAILPDGSERKLHATAMGSDGALGIPARLTRTRDTVRANAAEGALDVLTGILADVPGKSVADRFTQDARERARATRAVDATLHVAAGTRLALHVLGAS